MLPTANAFASLTKGATPDPIGGRPGVALALCERQNELKPVRDLLVRSASRHTAEVAVLPTGRAHLSRPNARDLGCFPIESFAAVPAPGADDLELDCLCALCHRHSIRDKALDFNHLEGGRLEPHLSSCRLWSS